MDKEQAIEIIETHSDDISSSSLLGLALNMAIEALKAQLSQQGTTKGAISRQAAIDALQNCHKHCIDPFDSYHIDIQDAENQLSKVPTVQTEPSIPLSWIEEQIERLKGMDNAFATLTAMQISVMVKKWRREQNETD